METLEDRLGHTTWVFHEGVHHIRIKEDICRRCVHRACIHSCPAGCYSLVDGVVVLNDEQCLECGTCLLICDKGAVVWNYPKGGFGVCYKEG